MALGDGAARVWLERGCARLLYGSFCVFLLRTPFSTSLHSTHSLVLSARTHPPTHALAHSSTRLFTQGVSRESPALGGFITIQANGTWDPTSHARFWNGKACCDHNEMNPNDKKYLVDLVNEAKSKYNVDASKVFAFGHSNGGLMAQILVCQESEVRSSTHLPTYPLPSSSLL